MVVITAAFQEFASRRVGREERQESIMHISYKPLWHTLIERNMRKEDLRLAAGLTTNMIANMGKEGKHISMDTLARICGALGCDITDVIELADDGASEEKGKKHGKDGKRITESQADNILGNYDISLVSLHILGIVA